MAKDDSKTYRTDSSMSTAGRKLCTDTECVGQLADTPEEGLTKDGRPSGKDQAAKSSMRAGEHHCVDDQCIGKG